MEIAEIREVEKYFLTERTPLWVECTDVRMKSRCDFGEVVCVSDRIMETAFSDFGGVSDPVRRKDPADSFNP